MCHDNFQLAHVQMKRQKSWWSLHLRLWTSVCGTLTAAAQDTWLDTSLSLRFSSLRNVVISLLVMEADHRLKEREPFHYLAARHCKCAICRRSESEPLEHKSDMWSKLYDAVLKREMPCVEWTWKETHKWSSHSRQLLWFGPWCWYCMQ